MFYDRYIDEIELYDYDSLVQKLDKMINVGLLNYFEEYYKDVLTELEKYDENTLSMLRKQEPKLEQLLVSWERLKQKYDGVRGNTVSDKVMMLKGCRNEIFNYKKNASLFAAFDNADKILKWIELTILNIDKERRKQDGRITGHLSKDEIYHYFTQLMNFKHKGSEVMILNKEQIEHLLCANFIEFEPRMNIKIFKVDMDLRNKLIDFVYKFHEKHNNKPKSATTEYANFLKNNFDVFENWSITTIKGEFSRHSKKQ